MKYTLFVILTILSFSCSKRDLASNSIQDDWRWIETTNSWFGIITPDSSNSTWDLSFSENQIISFRENYTTNTTEEEIGNYTIEEKESQFTGKITNQIITEIQSMSFTPPFYEIESDTLNIWFDCIDCSSMKFVRR